MSVLRPAERSAAHDLQVAVNERFKSLVNYTIVEKPFKGETPPYVILGEPEYVEGLSTKTTRAQRLKVRIMVYDNIANSDTVKAIVNSLVESLSATKLLLENDFAIFGYRVGGILPELINNDVWKTTISFIFDIYQKS
jgi:hypothetical protein